VNARHILAALALAATALSPALAERIELNEKNPVVVRSDIAYVLYRVPAKHFLQLLREVTPEERAAQEAKRAAAYAKASAKYEKAIAKYRRDKTYWGAMSADDRLLAAKPVEPALVSEETFFYPPPELVNFINVSRPFARFENGYAYLLALEPGRYTIYGPLIAGANGVAMGTCFCMGSIQFDAPAGKIVDLGTIGDGVKFGTGTGVLTPARLGQATPAQLAGQTIVPATLRAAGKMPNYNGIMIDRMPAIPGVLAYRRDTVIDVASGKEVEPLR